METLICKKLSLTTPFSSLLTNPDYFRKIEYVTQNTELKYIKLTSRSVFPVKSSQTNAKSASRLIKNEIESRDSGEGSRYKQIPRNVLLNKYWHESE